MQTRNVPLTGPRYWVAMAAASIFGVNLGDFIARVLHLGHWKSLPILLALFVAVLLLERSARVGREAFYWTAVVIERTAATGIADTLTHDLDLPYALILGACTAGLVGVIALGGIMPPRSASQTYETGPAPGSLANARYWVAMLVAETLGTALSDAFSDWLDLSFAVECAVLLGMFAIVFGLRTQRAYVNRLTYWLAVLVVGTCGPTAGDWLAHSGHLRLATFVTGVGFAALVLVWPRDAAPGPVTHQTPSAAG